MIRRQFITAAGASVGLLLMANRNAIAQIRDVATPTADGTPKPEFAFEDYSQAETMYLGMLFTWLELLDDTLDTLLPGIETLEGDSESFKAKAELLMPLGVWSHLAADVRKFEAPDIFTVVQAHTVDAFTSLGDGAEIISTGVIEGNASAIMFGTEHIRIATDHIVSLMEALSFDRPDRSIVSNG